MYVHRSESNPYSCTMISPSAPPISEEFFYASSNTTNPKEDQRQSFDLSTSISTSAPFSSDHRNNGALASSSSPNASELADENSRYIFRRQEYQYDSSLPPPYQVTAPLLATSEEETEHAARTRPLPDSEMERENQRSPARSNSHSRRNTIFSLWLFMISLLFLAAGLAFLLASVVITHFCRRECGEIEGSNTRENPTDDCGRICPSILRDIFTDGGIAITAVAGLASISQLFLLSMSRLYMCFSSNPK